MKTRTGTYVGEKDGKVVYYLGIPYAQAPVGDLRWKAPEPLPPSDAVIEAKNFGASAMQVENRGVLSERHRQDEDCLTLNVCVAAQEAEGKRPVLVLFHHSGFAFGGSADPLLYGKNYISTFPDVVLVTFNYRLGIFGFVDFSEVPGGEAYADVPNLDLLDQIAALRWAKENIAAFGGDPDRITVAGFESGATGNMGGNPYLCMEVGMTRWVSEKTKADEWDRTVAAYPPDSERMDIEEMILGYTINGAIQLGIEASKGSIEVGKYADFLVFDDDLLTAEPEGFSHHKPSEVYFCGKKTN